jgi:Asp-tRNA(Asn)/Glu-tRNA(Gln) amidotransferase A subunit family amidase
MTPGITRRDFVHAGALLTLGGLFALPSQRSAAADARSFGEYRRYDALGLAELVRRGDASPQQLLDLAIARTEAIDPQINAVVARHDDLARQAIRNGLPEGPFKGVPYLLKDLGIALAGTVTTDGSRFFADVVYDHDSTLVERYQAAGLVIFGKTHSPEFGGSPSSESRLFGATHNPWNPALSAGGSSGGSAAAVAAGIVPAAHASDGGGSIRIPASCCGLFGLKPARGRVPMGPGVYETRNGLSAMHAVSRSVRDSAALLDISQGPAPGDAYAAPRRERPYLEELKHSPGKLRIALMTHTILGIPVAPECVTAAKIAGKLLESLGHQVEIAAPELDVGPLYGALGISSNVLVAEKVQGREALLGRSAGPEELEPVTRHGLKAGRAVNAVAYSRARKTLHRASRTLASFMQRYDAILSPTLALVPPALGVLSLDQPYEDFMTGAAAASAFTALYNMTGQPAMSVPLHWTDAGVPVGVMFAGRFGDEATLFRLAAQLEQAAPWFDRVPSI